MSVDICLCWSTKANIHRHLQICLHVGPREICLEEPLKIYNDRVTVSQKTSPVHLICWAFCLAGLKWNDFVIFGNVETYKIWKNFMNCRNMFEKMYLGIYVPITKFLILIQIPIIQEIVAFIIHVVQHQIILIIG